MQIVIDLPNSLYANLQKIQNGSIASGRILKIVKDGTVLPKNHGRLIDASQLYTVTTYDADDNHEICYVLYEDIENAPTILEAEVEND